MDETKKVLFDELWVCLDDFTTNLSDIFMQLPSDELDLKEVLLGFMLDIDCVKLYLCDEKENGYES